MKTILFIDRNAIVKRTPIGGNTSPDKIMPHIYTAQSKYIQPLLGTVLYTKLQDDIQSNSLSGDYQTLVEDYIVDTLVHYTFVEYLPFSWYSFGEGGTMNLNPEFTQVPSKTNLDYILQKELQTAQFFAERLVEYLIAHNTQYPEYNQTTGKSDNIYPNKKQNYNIGWHL